MKKLITLVPIYKPTLPPLERYSLDHSLAALPDQEIFFIGPHGLDRDFYTARYGKIPFIGFDPAYFQSIGAYSRLLLSTAFYDQFSAYEYMLITQTDAIILRDDLDYWCSQPFDYVGAPWPQRYELLVNMGRFAGENAHKVSVTVGNGGLSLRRIRTSRALIEEFSEITDFFTQSGSSEDLFFSVMGALSHDFVVPNEITASRFSMELTPAYYYALNGGKVPMGGHAWWFVPEFWEPYLRGNVLSSEYLSLR